METILEKRIFEEIKQLKTDVEKERIVVKEFATRLDSLNEMLESCKTDLAGENRNIDFLFGVENTNRKKRPIDFTVNENGCFICTSHSKNYGGYPQMGFNGKAVVMARFIYSQCIGLIPDGWVIRHKCDNPGCINPEHLGVGTKLDNSDDMKTRGRSLLGEKSNRGKLTETDVIDIKKRLSAGESGYKIANLYDVKPESIYAIKYGKSWSHVKI